MGPDAGNGVLGIGKIAMLIPFVICTLEHSQPKELVIAAFLDYELCEPFAYDLIFLTFLVPIINSRSINTRS